MDVDMVMDMDVQARVVYEVVVAKACLICVAIRSPCGCAGGRATARCPVSARDSRVGRPLIEPVRDDALHVNVERLL